MLPSCTLSMIGLASLASRKRLMRMELVLSVISNFTTQAFRLVSSLCSTEKTLPSTMMVPMSIFRSFIGVAGPRNGFP